MNKLGISKTTPLKLNEFKTLMAAHISIVKQILRNYEKWGYKNMRYQYIDIYAGPGKYQLQDGDMVSGSPLIFLEIATQVGINYDAYFIDNSKKRIEALRELTKDFPNVICIRGDNREKLKEIELPNNTFGLLYADPNATCPQLPTIRKYFERENAQKVDILFYLGGNGIKRSEKNKCVKCELHEELGNLTHCFSNLKKYYTIRSNRIGIWGFTWAMFTNHTLMLEKYKKMQFVNGYEADIFLKSCMCTKEYLKKRGGVR
jgi:three-Cys-motif partner protein